MSTDIVFKLPTFNDKVNNLIRERKESKMCSMFCDITGSCNGKKVAIEILKNKQGDSKWRSPLIRW